MRFKESFSFLKREKQIENEKFEELASEKEIEKFYQRILNQAERTAKRYKIEDDFNEKGELITNRAEKVLKRIGFDYERIKSLQMKRKELMLVERVAFYKMENLPAEKKEIKEFKQKIREMTKKKAEMLNANRSQILSKIGWKAITRFLERKPTLEELLFLEKEIERKINNLRLENGKLIFKTPSLRGIESIAQSERLQKFFSLGGTLLLMMLPFVVKLPKEIKEKVAVGGVWEKLKKDEIIKLAVLTKNYGFDFDNPFFKRAMEFFIKDEANLNNPELMFYLEKYTIKEKEDFKNSLLKIAQKENVAYKKMVEGPEDPREYITPYSKEITDLIKSTEKELEKENIKVNKIEILKRIFEKTIDDFELLSSDEYIEITYPKKYNKYHPQGYPTIKTTLGLKNDKKLTEKISGVEIWRKPDFFLKEKRGTPRDFCLFLCSVAENLGLKCKIKFGKIPPSHPSVVPESHVFCTISLNGKEYVIDPALSKNTSKKEEFFLLSPEKIQKNKEYKEIYEKVEKVLSKDTPLKKEDFRKFYSSKNGEWAEILTKDYVTPQKLWEVIYPIWFYNQEVLEKELSPEEKRELFLMGKRLTYLQLILEKAKNIQEFSRFIKLTRELEYAPLRKERTFKKK